MTEKLDSIDKIFNDYIEMRGAELSDSDKAVISKLRSHCQSIAAKTGSEEVALTLLMAAIDSTIPEDPE